MSDSQNEFEKDIAEMLALIKPTDESASLSDYEPFELKEFEVDNTEREKLEVLNNLLNKTSVEEAESLNDKKPESRWLTRFAVPKNDTIWIEFKSQIQEGDELWTYSNVDVYLGFCCGGEGYAIVRNGDLVAEYITAIIN